MTRDEEILKQVIKEQSPEWRAGFISGANWADANPYLYEEELVGMGGLGIIWQKKALIKKACEFIRKGGMRGDGYIVTEFGEEVFDFIQFAEDIRKYMEEE